MIRHHIKEYFVIVFLFLAGAGWQSLINNTIENTVEQRLRHHQSSELLQYSLYELTELRVE